MKKILFITTRNVLNTCGELRLIKNRAETLLNRWRIHTDFIVICSNSKIRDNNELIDTGSMEIYHMETTNPFSIFSAFRESKSRIMDLVFSGDYEAVILSGVGTLHYLKGINKIDSNIPVIADIHGSNIDMIEFSKGKSFVKRSYQKIVYLFEEFSDKILLKKVQALFVVSQALAEHVKREYHLKEQHKYYIAPCAVDVRGLDLEKTKEYRKKYREKYDVASDEILFVYSGGISPWQRIDESIKIYNEIKDSKKFKCKMLILSHHIEQIIPMIGDSEDVITDSLPSDQVSKVLCAGDYAFLIRDDIVTNNVAYPNKFLEYVQSGMKIISTPHVFDVAKQINHFGVGITLELENDYITKLLEYIDGNLTVEIDFNRRRDLLGMTSFENSLEDFVSDFSLVESSIKDEFK